VYIKPQCNGNNLTASDSFHWIQVLFPVRRVDDIKYIYTYIFILNLIIRDLELQDFKMLQWLFQILHKEMIDEYSSSSM